MNIRTPNSCDGRSMDINSLGSHCPPPHPELRRNVSLWSFCPSGWISVYCLFLYWGCNSFKFPALCGGVSVLTTHSTQAHHLIFYPPVAIKIQALCSVSTATCPNQPPRDSCNIYSWLQYTVYSLILILWGSNYLLSPFRDETDVSFYLACLVLCRL